MPAETTVPPATTPPADGVGVTTLNLTDESRSTPSSGDVAEQPERAIDLTIFYPALTAGQSDTVEDAPPADTGPYPLIVFAHGFSATPMLYADLFTEWVTAGFIVAAPSFPLTKASAPAGPDATDTQNQPGDVSFVIDEVTRLAEADTGILAGRVDIEMVGLAGHSNGAITTLATTAHSCCFDDRIDAAIVAAGSPAPFGGGSYDFAATPPILFVHGTADALVAFDSSVPAFNEMTSSKGFLVLDDAEHTSPLLAGSPLFPGVADVTTDFWSANLSADNDAVVRLEAGWPGDAPATLHFAAEPDSGLTIEPLNSELFTRSASVEPSTGLVNGQTVTVSWSGFTDGTVNIVQCSKGGLTGSAACDLVTGHILQANPTGEGSMELTIVVGTVGNGTCDAATNDCVIIVNDAGLPDEDASFLLPISFAPQ